MEPENEPLEEEIPIGNHPFSGAMLVSRRVMVDCWFGARWFGFRKDFQK